MSKHTPGPWAIEDNPTINEQQQVAAFSEDGNRVLQIIVRSFNPKEDMSLIAAAPDLLNAVRFLLSNHDNRISKPDHDAAYAAIAKATGESN